MKILITILGLCCALLEPFAEKALWAQSACAVMHTAPFSRFTRPAWPHRPGLRASTMGHSHPNPPPDLFKTLTGNWLTSFDKVKTDLFKNRLTQNNLISQNLHQAQHTLSGGVQMAWANHYGAQLLPGDGEAADLAVDRDGNVYVTGYLTRQPYGADYFTVKYNAAGRKLWEARYNGEYAGDDFATAIAVDRDGNVYVTGGSETGASVADYVTIKYNADGATLWTARYDFSSAARPSYDVATAMAIDELGSVYVSGWSENDFATVKYNAAGVVQWRARYPGSGNTAVSALAVDRFGHAYLAGQTNDAFIIVKYDSAGQKEWSAGYSEFAGSSGIATALAVDRRGEVYVTGMYEGLSYPQYLTMKFSREGAREWAAFYRGPDPCNWNIATALALDDSGNVYVTGESGRFYEDCSDGLCVTRDDIDYATIKYNRAGEEQWSVRYGPADGCSHAAAVKVDRAGNVVVTGYDRRDFATLKYDRDGRQQWLATFEDISDADDVAVASAIDEAGNVYVTGWSMRNQDKDFATVKYDHAGTVQWVTRENSPGNSFDRATALALDASGNVYVAGASQTLSDASSVWCLINYNAAGATNWQRHGQSAKDIRSRAEKIATDANGNIYVIGSRHNLSRQDYHYGTLSKYNHAGAELWSTAFDSTANQGRSLPVTLDVDRAGNIYVTGASHNADWVTIKYDAGGNVLWKARENPGPQSFSGATTMARDDSGNVYVAGVADGDGVTIKYNAAGMKQWLARYHATEAIHRVAGIVVSRENIYVLAGIGFYADYLTLKYDRDGQQQWEARHSRAGNSFDHPAALAVDDRENAYVTGEAGTIKYDRDGVKLWCIETGATALTVDAAGNLYTTGVCPDSASTDDAADLFTVKYNAFGMLEWSARYDGPGNSLDYPVAIALDPSRNIYVAGQSRAVDSSRWSFFTTIKYTQNSSTVNDKAPNRIGSSQLAQNFPNPFNPATRIRFTLAQPGRASLKIFDVLGREVATLVDEMKSAGEHAVQWTPENLPAGVYIYRLQASDVVESKKLIYLP